MKEIHVMIVDNDPQVRSELSAVLRFRGCRVQTASNGAEALRLLEGVQPSLVLLEMRTPVMDGWGFARELNARRISVPIVVMGPEGQAQNWAVEINAAGFLPKPVKVSRLLACVQIPGPDESVSAA